MHRPPPSRRIAPRLIGAAGVVALAAGLSLGSPPADGLLEAIAVSGCELYRVGGVCEVASVSQLRLWVKAAEGVQLSVSARDGRSFAEALPRSEGHRFQIKPGGAVALVLRAEAPWGRQVHTISLQPHQPPPVLAQAIALQDSQRTDEARALLLSALRVAVSVDVQSRIVSRLARVVLNSPHPAEAEGLLRGGMALNHAAGLVSEEVRDTKALAHVLNQADRLDELHKLLEEQRTVLEQMPEGRIGLNYFAAEVRRKTGDLRTALRLYSEADAWAERIADKERQDMVRDSWSLVLQQLGLTTQACAKAASLPQDVCETAIALNNRASWSILAAQMGLPAPPCASDPAALLRQAWRGLQECPRSDPGERASVLTNQAALALHSQDPWQRAQVDGLIQRARAEAPHPPQSLAMEWSLLLGRQALRRGRADDALRAFQEVTAQGGLVSPQTRWQGEVGRAEALTELHRLPEALAAYQGAERLLDASVLLAPLREAHGVYLFQHAFATERYLRLLLRARRDGEALDLVRRSGARKMLALLLADILPRLPEEARQRWARATGQYLQARRALEEERSALWQVPMDQLAPHRAGLEARAGAIQSKFISTAEDLLPALPATWAFARPGRDQLFLFYYPLDGGWVGFALGPAGKPLVRRGSGDDAKALFEPFQRQIEGARWLRVTQYGALRERAIHTRLRAWWSRADRELPEVVYGFDLPVAGAPAPPARARRPRHALVVSDSQGNLAGAGAGGSAVVALLRAAAWEVDGLGHGWPLKATGPQLRARLPWADLLHYTGHAIFAGPGGWDSELQLADGTSLTTGDILLAERVPQVVMLSACEAGRSGHPADPIDGLSIAQAFVARGSHIVLAATRKITSEVLDDAFYQRYLAQAPEEDVVVRAARALAQRQRQPRATDKLEDLEDFRAYVR